MMIILASNSPRRKELISLLGTHFQARPAEVDESVLPGESPLPYVLRLAESKARAVASLVPSDSLVIAADTTVADGLDILGKPDDERQAVEMLSRLAGHTHQVHTAIALLDNTNGALFLDVCTTEVPMRAYTQEEIDAYVATGDPMDKAGAYAIQHAGFHPVDHLAGCYANVVGLPLCQLTRLLRLVDFTPIADIPSACQNTLSYDCPVFRAILGDHIKRI